MDEKTHKTVIEYTQVACLDILVLCEDRYLLVKRELFPAPEWWALGGRIFLEETVDEAIVRIAKNEAGLDVTPKRLLGVETTKFERGPYENQPITTFNAVYLATAKSFDVKLDANHSAFEWRSISDNIDSSLHPYVRNFISIAFLET